MKYLTLATFLAVYAYGYRQNNDTLIWRSIPIRNSKFLMLDSSITLLGDLAIKDTRKSYHLKNGSFEGADSIVIKTNRSKRIKAIVFYYDTIYSFEKYIAAMEQSLKTKGTVFTIEKKSHTRLVAEWRDAYSRFQVVEQSDKNGTRIYSIVDDL